MNLLFDKLYILQLQTYTHFYCSISRYIDDIFMTTNESVDEIQTVLNKAKTKDINIEIECTIDTSVNYLDVTITNENGHLRTSVYHKPTAEPYYLPYTSDHPHKYHRNIPYTALIRAARLCSNVHAFNLERIRIDMSLLLSEYPPKFITNQFLRFFQVHNAMPVLTELNQQTYERLHQKLIHNTTVKEQQLNEKIKNPVKYPDVLENKTWDPTLMYISYPFESGPKATFSHQFKSWWKKHYQYPGSPANKVKVRLQPKTNRTLARHFIHKKPPRHMLRITEQPSN